MNYKGSLRPGSSTRKKAERVLEVIQLFHHVKGEWAQRKETIHLEDWQCFFIAMIFGWVDKKNRIPSFYSSFALCRKKKCKDNHRRGYWKLHADGGW